MRRIYFGCLVLVLALLFCCELGFCGELSQIKLDDGSMITGELVSVDDGVYTIKTTSLGEVQVQSADVVSINKQTAVSKSSAKSQIPAGQLNALQQQLMGNEEIMNMIFSLQSDPNIQKALQDPEFMNAVNSMDVNALQANPLFKDILQNPTIQKIKEKSGE